MSQHEDNPRARYAKAEREHAEAKRALARAKLEAARAEWETVVPTENLIRAGTGAAMR
jgi:hypothetical protein